MKKSVIYVLSIFLTLCSCSPKSVPDDPKPDPPEEENEEIDIFKDCCEVCFDEFVEKHFDEYFEDLDYQYAYETETYHLLEAVIDYIGRNHGPLIGHPSSSFDYPSITKFNERFRDSEETAALFEREDCGFVLISIYLDYLITKRYLTIDSEWGISKWYRNRFFTYLEVILFSEMCMEKLNTKEKVQLMALVLERMKCRISNTYCFNIVISIMLSSDYPPFINDLKPMLHENNGAAFYIYLPWENAEQARDLTIIYAIQFINDNK